MCARALVALALAASCAGPRGPAAVATPGERTSKVAGDRLPAGARLVAALDEGLSTDEASAGDRFTATVTTPIVWDGRALPSGCLRIVGHVIRAESGQGARPAQLELAIDALEAGPIRRPLEARVTAVALELTEERVDPAQVRRGRYAGALLGGIFFFLPGAVVGYRVGELAGYGRAVARRGVEASLLPGARLTVQLDEPLPLAPLRNACLTRSRTGA